MSKSTLAIAFAFILLWNSGFIGAEYGLPYAGPFTFIFWRYAALVLLLLVYLMVRGRIWWPGLRRVAPTLVVGVLAHGAWLSCVHLSLLYQVPAGIVALIVALQPMAVGALSGLVVGEPTPLHRWTGLLIGFAGVAITVGARINFADAHSVFGNLIPFGSVLAMTAAALIQRRLEVFRPSFRLPMDITLFYQSLATAVALFLPSVFAEGLATEWTTEFVWTTFWLVIGVSLGAYVLMWILIARIDATRVSSLFYLGPPVTMLMGWAAFGDTLEFMDVVGLAVVFVGVVLTQLKGVE